MSLQQHQIHFSWTSTQMYQIFPGIEPLHHKQAFRWRACTRFPWLLPPEKCCWRDYLSVRVLLKGLKEDKSLWQQLDFPECFLHTCNFRGTAGLRSKNGWVMHWTRWMAVKQYITLYMCHPLTHKSPKSTLILEYCPLLNYFYFKYRSKGWSMMNPCVMIQSFLPHLFIDWELMSLGVKYWTELAKDRISCRATINDKLWHCHGHNTITASNCRKSSALRHEHM